MIALLLIWVVLAQPYDPPCIQASAVPDSDGYALTLNSLSPESGWTVWTDHTVVAFDGTTFGAFRPSAPIVLPPFGQVQTRGFTPYTLSLCAPGQPLPRVFLPLIS